MFFCLFFPITLNLEWHLLSVIKDITSNVVSSRIIDTSIFLLGQNLKVCYWWRVRASLLLAILPGRGTLSTRLSNMVLTLWLLILIPSVVVSFGLMELRVKSGVPFKMELIKN